MKKGGRRQNIVRWVDGYVGPYWLIPLLGLPGLTVLLMLHGSFSSTDEYFNPELEPVFRLMVAVTLGAILSATLYILLMVIRYQAAWLSLRLVLAMTKGGSAVALAEARSWLRTPENAYGFLDPKEKTGPYGKIPWVRLVALWQADRERPKKEPPERIPLPTEFVVPSICCHCATSHGIQDVPMSYYARSDTMTRTVSFKLGSCDLCRGLLAAAGQSKDGQWIGAGLGAFGCLAGLILALAFSDARLTFLGQTFVGWHLLVSAAAVGGVASALYSWLGRFGTDDRHALAAWLGAFPIGVAMDAFIGAPTLLVYSRTYAAAFRSLNGGAADDAGP